MRLPIGIQFLAPALVLIGGCTTPSTDLVRAGLLTIDSAQPNALHHPPEAHERQGNLVVTGELDPSEAVDDGHVDIAVLAPDGTAVFEATAQYKRPATERGGPRGQSRGPLFPSDWRAKYSAEFTGLPPAGSVVRVSVHAGPHVPSGSGR